LTTACRAVNEVGEVARLEKALKSPLNWPDNPELEVLSDDALVLSVLPVPSRNSLRSVCADWRVLCCALQ